MKKIFIILIILLTIINCNTKNEKITTKDEYIFDNDNHEFYTLLKKATLEEEKGNYKKAEKIYLEATKFNKVAYIYIAEMYVKVDEEIGIKKSIEAYEKGNKVIGNLLGEIYEKRKNYEEAEKWYKNAIDGKGFEAFKNLGDLYSKLGKKEEAEKSYIEAGNLRDAESMIFLVQTYFMKKDTEKMKYWQNKLQNTKKIFSFDDNVKERLEYSLSEKEEDKKFFELLIKAEEELEKSNYEQAEKYYLELEKINSHGLLYSADFYYQIKENEELGIKKYIEAYENGVVEASKNLANIEHRNSNIEEAKKWYEIAANNGFVNSQYYYAQLLNEEGNPNEAIKWYITSAKNGNFNSLLVMLTSYYNKGEKEKMKEYLDIVLNSNMLKNYSRNYEYTIEKYERYLKK